MYCIRNMWRWIKVAPLLLSILIPSQIAADGEEAKEGSDTGSLPRRQILVLGGNGFMGSSTVSNLIKPENDIVIVNRGSWYFDSKERVFQHVKHVYCDRHERIAEKCYEFMEFIKDKTFDFVIDFSSYDGRQSEEMMSVLQGKVSHLYIMVSTDSVYDVCNKQHNGFTKESDSVRPEQIGERDLLAQLHRYGHNKLSGEEALIEQRVNGGFPFVILRLPDVIGARDTTHRWWIYQLWIKLSPIFDDHPVTVPEFLNDYPMSFVYSDDVANVVVQLLDMGPQIKDQTINLAWPDPVTLKGLFQDIQEALGMDKGGFVEVSDAEAFYLYPTVRKGPIDAAKAQNLLHWEPTLWKEAINNTVQFYENAFTDEKFAEQRNEIIQVVATQLFTDHQSAFYEGLEKIYKVDLNHFKNPKDEL